MNPILRRFSAAAVLAGCLATARGQTVGELRANYDSRAPKFAFSETPPEKEQELRDNPLLRRYTAARSEQRRHPGRPSVCAL
jgi:hypothetical protein